MPTEKSSLEGGCACDELRYRLTSPPLFVHCCHCSRCQTETGTAFVLNALIESDRVETTRGHADWIGVPTDSGKDQQIARCRTCQVAVWSTYAGAGPQIRFVRVGTLDRPEACPPDIHIYTASRLAWFVLPEDTPAVDAYYRAQDHWPRASLDRYKAAVGRRR